MSKTKASPNLAAEGSLRQHLLELEQNRCAWQQKPLLRSVYADMFRQIKLRLGRSKGLCVEIGSGLGAIKDIISDCVTTDLWENPWLDRYENIYSMSFPNNSVANLILFDVWHHLRHPGTALKECNRVLTNGGRIILCEPGIGWLGRVIYGCFHHEPLGLDKSVAWEASPDWIVDGTDYYAAQGNAWRAFVWGDRPSTLYGFRLVEVKPIAALVYVLSGGFRGPQLVPSWAHAALRPVVTLLGRIPTLFATRLFVTLEKI